MLQNLTALPLPLKCSLLGLVLGTLSVSAAASDPVNPGEGRGAMESEYCEVLHRFNAKKKISDPEVRQRYEGEYGQAEDTGRLRTWRVETVCGDFLVAVPLWADVSPPVLSFKGEDELEDSMGATWKFQVDEAGTVTGVLLISSDGAETMMRVWGDPHINHEERR